MSDLDCGDYPGIPTYTNFSEMKFFSLALTEITWSGLLLKGLSGVLRTRKSLLLVGLCGLCAFPGVFALSALASELLKSR